jgi:hypothetical protein
MQGQRECSTNRRTRNEECGERCQKCVSADLIGDCGSVGESPICSGISAARQKALIERTEWTEIEREQAIASEDTVRRGGQAAGRRREGTVFHKRSEKH